MNRRGFLRAAVAAGLALGVRGPVAGAEPAERENTGEALIRRALREHRMLGFHYHDHTRRVEPHALGRMKDGRVALLAWQVSGGSRSEPPPGWRNFLVGEITGLEMSAERFGIRPGYRPERTRFHEILAEVAP